VVREVDQFLSAEKGSCGTHRKIVKIDNFFAIRTEFHEQEFFT